LRPYQAVAAPNVPHDIAVECEEEERLSGATFGALELSRAHFFVLSLFFNNYV